MFGDLSYILTSHGHECMHIVAPFAQEAANIFFLPLTCGSLKTDLYQSRSLY